MTSDLILIIKNINCEILKKNCEMYLGGKG